MTERQTRIAIYKIAVTLTAIDKAKMLAKAANLDAVTLEMLCLSETWVRHEYDARMRILRICVARKKLKAKQQLKKEKQ